MVTDGMNSGDSGGSGSGLSDGGQHPSFGPQPTHTDGLASVHKRSSWGPVGILIGLSLVFFLVAVPHLTRFRPTVQSARR